MTRRVTAIALAAIALAAASSISLSAQGGVAALGQEVKRKAAPTGPVSHLPDGTVDFSGLWVGGGPIQDIEREGGLPRGTLESLMTPSAKATFASRKEVDNPQFHCLPMGVPRATPLSVPHRAGPDTREDAVRLHPARREHPFLPPGVHGRPQASGGARPDVVRPFDRPLRGQHARHRHGRLQRQVVVRQQGLPAHRAVAHDRTLDARGLRPHDE
jgi:hypothetical protein